MSPSSGGEWGERDVIDLDRYMRGHARTSTTSSEERQQCDSEQLVVDAGGAGRALVSEARYKQHSHDSGVSAGSYGTRRHHRPRRVSNSNGRFGSREQTSARTFTGPAHSDSLQAFRTVCEQALLDQQKQIARVAQLCEKLAEKADEEIAKKDVSERLSRKDEQITEQKPEKRNVRERVQLQSDTSDISSSSRSTRDQRQKEKQRTQECKTYKIIMSKLDELNRRFSSGPPSSPPAPSAPHPRPPSSGSVSVCDKHVATDQHRTVDKVIRPTQRSQLVRQCGAPVPMTSRARVVTHAYSVDIAPRHFMQSNVATESVVKCESNGSGSSAGDPRCHFDLEDPVHLYSQAKRLQALNATIRRARSHSSAGSRSNARACSNARMGSNARADASARASKVRERSPSICSVCRGYWRSLRQCIVAPFVQCT